MSSRSRKVAEFALGSSLAMFVLILITFVTAAVGDHLSCDEYCTLLKSSQIGSSRRPECNCHPQNVEAGSDKSRSLGSNPIYYEPVELHPLPDVSFVYQPFVISNPISSSDNKPITRPLSNQETEHHRKYKRKDNVIHKISIDTSKKPLYLDIDIKNTRGRSRSSQNYSNEFDDVRITEQDLKECIDLHLLFHFRRNESDKLKINWNVENLEKYLHISDDDLMMELSKKCKQPSDIVDQSLREIKESIRAIKPQYSNYSETDRSDTKHNMSLENAQEDNIRVNKSFILNSTEVPRIIPENNLLNSINKEENNQSKAYTFNKTYINTQPPNHFENEIIKLSEESYSVIPIQKLDKLANTEKHNKNKFDNNKPDTTNKTSKHIQDDISYRSVYDKPKFEQKSTAKLPHISALEKDDYNKKSAEDMVMNSVDFLTMAPVTSVKMSQSLEENDHSGKLTENVNELFSTTTQNSFTGNEFVTRKSLNNDLNIENASMRDDTLNTSTIEMENDLDQSSSNMEHIFIKYTDNLPEITTKKLLGISSEKPRSNEDLVVSTVRNMNKYDPTPPLILTHLKNYSTIESDMTTIASFKKTPISNTAYSEDHVALFASTTEENVSNNITYVNRTIIPENKLQIPRIFVTEYSNETLDSTIDGIEEMPNNDYVGITNFEMDVEDLTSNDVKSTNDNLNSIVNDEHNETSGKEAGESAESSQISGNLYFMFKKLLIPMRFIQASDGELKLILDRASFCKNLLSNVKNNSILAILCNSAVHDKNKCTKI